MLWMLWMGCDWGGGGWSMVVRLYDAGMGILDMFGKSEGEAEEEEEGGGGLFGVVWMPQLKFNI